jgi:hypothetical protein
MASKVAQYLRRLTEQKVEQKLVVYANPVRTSFICHTTRRLRMTILCVLKDLDGKIVDKILENIWTPKRKTSPNKHMALKRLKM